MTPSRSPRLATFLMNRLAGCDPILLGDLEEEYRAGRSRWWYWREAVSVIVRSAVIAIRTHPVQFLRAIAALLFANAAAGFALWALPRQALFHLLPTWWFYGRYQVYTLAWIALLFPICAIATWSMARLHPDVRVPATVVVVVWSMAGFTGDPELQRLWATMPEPRFVPYFLRHVLGMIAWLTAMVTGGMFLPVGNRRSTT